MQRKTCIITPFNLSLWPLFCMMMYGREISIKFLNFFNKKFLQKKNKKEEVNWDPQSDTITEGKSFNLNTEGGLKFVYVVDDVTYTILFEFSKLFSWWFDDDIFQIWITHNQSVFFFIIHEMNINPYLSLISGYLCS